MPSVLAFIGRSNCGKTSLIEKLIPALVARGVQVGTIKHHHGDFMMDTPGKDTWRHKRAGAKAVLLASPVGIGFIKDAAADIPIEDLVSTYFHDIDLVIIEGCKQTGFPKIEVFLGSACDGPLPGTGKNPVAMVSDVRLRHDIPWFSPDDIDPLAEFVLTEILPR
jgi:molybdopterin-guanine dinucleotide biosynthesis protein B